MSKKITSISNAINWPPIKTADGKEIKVGGTYYRNSRDTQSSSSKLNFVELLCVFVNLRDRCWIAQVVVHGEHTERKYRVAATESAIFSEKRLIIAKERSRVVERLSWAKNCVARSKTDLRRAERDLERFDKLNKAAK